MNSFENYYDRLIYLGASFRKHVWLNKDNLGNFEKKWLYKQLDAELKVMSARLQFEINILEKN